MIKYIDLFCGLGGFHISVENACKRLNLQSECVLASDIKPIAIKSYYDNFKILPQGDICKIPMQNIPNFDILCAGFPCQPFSSAGKRLGFEDTRGTLFFEIARILKDKQPQFAILENVEGLLTHNKGNTFSTIQNVLNDIGYNVYFKILNACDFGLPQARKRIYIVCSKHPIIDNELLFQNNLYKENVVIKDILYNKNNTYKEDDFAQKLLAHYDYETLQGKTINDKRGGENNIHSWDIGLRGDVSYEEKLILKTISQERRKRYIANEQNVPWTDGLGLTINQIQNIIHFKQSDIKKYLNHLIQCGYIKETYPKINKQLDTSKERIYDISTGKLSFPITNILDINSIAPTLTATDLPHTAIVDKNGIRNINKQELLGLFGYPKTYNIKEQTLSNCYDLFGNTICINVVENIIFNLLSLFY